MTKIPVADNPCASCPFRKDHPSGVWSREEYKKLMKWNGTELHEMCSEIFLCHSQNMGGKQAACRGWLDAASSNKGVRLLLMSQRFDHNGIPTKIPLHDTCRAASRAGLKNINKPCAKAKAMIEKLVEAKSRNTNPHEGAK